MDEAVKYLKVKKSTLYNWTMKRCIAVVKFGKLNRFRKEDLNYFIIKNLRDGKRPRSKETVRIDKKKERDELRTSYIKGLLKKESVENISDEMITLKRLSVIINRLIKENKNDENK
mgnify:CR=1 FL=1